MKITLQVGDQKQHRIEYSRNWFFGTEKLFTDGELIRSRSVISPSNYVSLPLTRKYEFTVGISAQHKVVFEKQRPLLLAGIRPHTYRIFVDDHLVYEKTGY